MVEKEYFTLNIIPLISLPPNSPDFFTYFSDEKLKPYSLVEIDFKNKIIKGVVFEVLKTSKARQEIKEILPKIKKINKVISYEEVLSSSDVFLIKWLSNYFGFSFPFILKNFFYPLIKLDLKDFFLQSEKRTSFKWLKEIDKLILKNKKTLVVVPEVSFTFEAENFFKKFNLPIFRLLPPLTKSKIEKLKIGLKNKELILITSKKLVFNLIDFFNLLIIYREGLFFYYDLFKNINFDYREIFKKLAVIKKRQIIFFDDFPSLDILKNREINLNFDFSVVNNFEEVAVLLKNFKKVIIFIPQKIKGRGLICQTCFYSLKCETCQSDLIVEDEKVYCSLCLKEKKLNLTICPNCKSKDSFSLKKIGAIGIYSLLKNLPNVYLIKRKTKKMIKEISKKESFILIGSLSLISGLTPEVEAVFFFNFENFYLSYDPFLREKYLRLLHYFNQKSKKVFLVTYLRNPLIEKEIKEGKILERILKERQVSKLPPYSKIIKIIKGSKDFYKIQKEFIELKEKLKKITPEEIIGPILAKPYRIRNKKFLEIIIRRESGEHNLKKILHLSEFKPEKIKINPLEV